MFYFVLYTALFAELMYVCKVNRAEVEEFDRVPAVIGYFLISFGNGIGNIVSPSYDVQGTSHLDYAMLYVIYLIWFLHIVIVLIVFLNFVIAVISDVYETVMDQKSRYLYVLR